MNEILKLCLNFVRTRHITRLQSRTASRTSLIEDHADIVDCLLVADVHRMDYQLALPELH